MFLLFSLPVANIILGLILLFKKGDLGPNQYGEEPQDIKHKFLIIILTIFVIYASIDMMPELDKNAAEVTVEESKSAEQTTPVAQ